ncbi:MAG: GNAT family N-acetyltransferase [Cyanothece sp. SIO1E1]|nr:GNAT family N-acetyltransferase [Cyanothece sp. SIO1E1]
MKTNTELTFRKPKPTDLPVLEDIRTRAFAPIFESFRKILGDFVYDTAQRHEDEQQSQVLADMFNDKSEWTLYVVELNQQILGFTSIHLNSSTGVGEIGLNAVDPSQSGKGMGTQMYNYAISEMRKSGMKVAVVATGGDDSHAAARRAYEKSGFNVSIPSLWMCQAL